MDRTLALGLEHVDRLRKLYRGKPRDTAAIERVAKDARSRLEEVILDDPHLAARREVEDQLWRYCYYKRIEEFRKNLAQAGRPSQASDAREAAQRQRALRGDFLHFLDVAQSQYSAFLDRLEEKRESTSSDEARKTLYATSIHRCHLFSGDLARYRELNDTSRDKKSFDAASRHYRQALKAYPHKGNPHNQLAVLAQYRNAMVIALFRYVMALSVAEPFETARTNLGMLYDAVLRDVRKRNLLSQTPLPANAPITGSQRAGLLRDFSFRFVLVHGMIAGRLKLKPEENTSLRTLVARVVDELALLVRKSALNIEMRLGLVVACISLILDARKSRADLRAAEALAFAVISTFAKHLADASSLAASSATPGEALAAVSVFLEWLRADAAAATSTQGTSIQVDREAAGPLWSSLATLWPSLVSAAQKSTSDGASLQDANDFVLLWEDLELEAFVPLQNSRGQKTVQALAGRVEPASQGIHREKAATERARRVCMICDWMARDPRRSHVLPFDARMPDTAKRSDSASAVSSAASILDEPSNSERTLSQGGPASASSSTRHSASLAEAGWSVSQAHASPRARTGDEPGSSHDDDNEDIIMLVPGALTASSTASAHRSSNSSSSTRPPEAASAVTSSGAQQSRQSPALADNAGAGLDASRLVFHLADDSHISEGGDHLNASFRAPALNPGSAFFTESASSAVSLPPSTSASSTLATGFPGALAPPTVFGSSSGSNTHLLPHHDQQGHHQQNQQNHHQQQEQQQLQQHQQQESILQTVGSHGAADGWQRPPGMDFVSKSSASGSGGPLLSPSDLLPSLPFLPPMDKARNVHANDSSSSKNRSSNEDNTNTSLHQARSAQDAAAGRLDFMSARPPPGFVQNSGN